jgi:hypothetical protein
MQEKTTRNIAYPYIKAKRIVYIILSKDDKSYPKA